MRVDEQTLTNQVSTTANRVSESQRIRVDSAASSTTSAAAGDHVDLSSFTGRISQALRTLSTQSVQRVNQLQKDFRSGRYQPDARQIAQAMAG